MVALILTLKIIYLLWEKDYKKPTRTIHFTSLPHFTMYITDFVAIPTLIFIFVVQFALVLENVIHLTGGHSAHLKIAPTCQDVPLTLIILF